MNRVREYLIQQGLIGSGAFRSRKLLDHAKGAPCMNCTCQDGTVVAAHANAQVLDKGGHHKAHDVFVAFLCFRCHSWLDQGSSSQPDPTEVFQSTEEDKAAMWLRAHWNTLLYLVMTGRLKVA